MTIAKTNFIMLIAFLCGSIYTAHADGNTTLKGTRWKIKKQSFASHDAKGTDTDSIEGQVGDFIFFNNNGLASCQFDNKPDTLEYKMIGKDSISFGDTPYAIRHLSNNRIELYQNEEETNGDYNRIWFILEKY